ncbi:MAG: hypothetical protein HOD92_15295 [Deltaproteobacteria bacterium]|mgnify:FL=1|jgi:hypothetical protein|nr:hypothetical protein [Deltaproteobacteria bacterium]
MFDFTPLQNIAIFVIVLLIAIFYIRRFWFWFWKVTKLLTQFDLVVETTHSTNEEVKAIKVTLDELKNSLGKLNSGNSA